VGLASLGFGAASVWRHHRLGSARLAGRVVVLKEGRVVEEGTHAQLLAAGGEYASLYRIQAAWYADEGQSALATTAASVEQRESADA
jgi:ABC-type glutathione transport system ATPase component